MAENIWTIQFISLTGSGNYHAFYKTHASARSAMDRARKAYRDMKVSQDDMFSPFCITDDFGVEACINMTSYTFLLTSSETAARIEKISTAANEHAREDMGISKKAGF